MSRTGKILLFAAVLSIVVGFGLRLLLGLDWMQLWMPPAVCFGLMVAAVVKDIDFFKEFMSMRTTKHGLNMGTLILLVLVLLFGVNFLLFRHNPKIDLTTEKLNTLSDQSKKIVQSLDSDLEVRAFFTSRSEDDEREKARFKAVIQLFEDESHKVKVSFVDPNRRPDLKKEFNVEASGSVVFSYKGKNTTVTDFTEEIITNALIKVTRDRNKVIAFMQGHGEVDLASDKADGGLSFKKMLEDTSYEVRSFSFVQTGALPTDADLIVVAGPKQPLLKPEVDALLEYAKKGGNLLLAADPGRPHNFKDFAKNFGVEFHDDYVLDQVGQLIGASAALAIGLEYSQTSEMTKGFQGNMMTGFQLAGRFTKLPTVPPTLRIDEVVKTGPASFAKKSIEGKVQFDPKNDPKGPHAILVSVEGKLQESSAKEFRSVLAADSDIFTNQLLNFQLNRSLIGNAVAFLAKDQDLISIRPKEPKGSRVTITETQLMLFKLLVMIPLPIILFVTSLVIWLRRRGA